MKTDANSHLSASGPGLVSIPTPWVPHLHEESLGRLYKSVKDMSVTGRHWECTVNFQHWRGANSSFFFLIP